MSELIVDDQTTREKIGKYIGEKLTKKGLYISDSSRKTIAYTNDKNEEIKDEKGKNMSKIWNTEPRSIEKLEEWNNIIKDKIDECIKYQYDNGIEKYHKIKKEQSEILSDPATLQREINKHLPDKYDKQEKSFHLSNLYKQIKDKIINYPKALFFDLYSFDDFLLNRYNEFVIDRNNYVINDEKQKVKLTDEDLLYIYKTLYSDIVNNNKPGFNEIILKAIKQEINDVKFNIKKDSKDDYMDYIKSKLDLLYENSILLSGEIKKDHNLISYVIDRLYGQ